MKFCFSFLFCFFISLSLTGQQRLTSYTDIGTNNDHYLRNFDEKSYLLIVDQFNKLEVYELLNENTKNLLHSRILQGIYDNDFDIEFKNNYMIFGNSSEIVDYDFVNDLINSAAIPEGFYFSNFSGLINSTDNRFLVSLKTLDQSIFKGVVYEIGGKIYDLNGRTSFMLFDDDVFDKFRTQAGTNNYYFKNFITDQTDTVTYNADFGQYPIQIENAVYYFDNEGQLNSFDKATRTSSLLTGVKLEQIGYTNSVFLKDDFLVLVSSSHDSITFQVYSHQNLTLHDTYSFYFDEPVFGSLSEINQGVFTALIDDRLFMLNLTTGQYFIRPTFYYWVSGFEVLEERYIINPYDFNGESQKFELIDLQELTREQIDGSFNISIYTYYAGFAKFNQTYLGAFKFYTRNVNSLFNIDLNNKTVEINEELDNTHFGFPSNSKVMKIGEELYLLGPDLHKIKDDSLKLIFASEDVYKIDYSAIVTDDKKIAFLQNEPRKIFVYDGESLVEEADISEFQGSFQSNQVNDFAIADDFVLLVGVLDKIYRFDKITMDVTILENHFIDYNDVLFSYKNKIYFSEGQNFYFTDGFNSTLILDNYYHPINGNDLGYHIFQGQLIVMTQNGMTRIESDGTSTELVSDMDHGTIDVLIDENNNNLLIGETKRKIHYDGDSVHEFELEFGSDYFDIPSSKNVFFFLEYDGMEQVASFFNSKTKESDKLPDEVQSYFVSNYCEANGEHFLFMRSGFNPYENLLIYKTDESFDEVELIKEYLDVGWFKDNSITKQNELGFVYMGNALFYMNESNQFIPIENVLGSHQSSNVEFNDSDLYFLGMDPLWGRQLFTLSLKDFVSGLDKVESVQSEFKVFPNPSSNQINLEYTNNNLLTSKSFSVFRSTGELVFSGQTSGLVDISSLTSGSYIITIQEDDMKVSKVFVKL